MADLVKLPSGATAPLVAPSPAAMLCCGGSLEGLARCVFAHEEVDVGRLSPDDVYAVAEWALDAFSEGDAALTLARMYVLCGDPPSRRLGIAEPLALAFDAACLSRLKPAGESSEDAEECDLQQRLAAQRAEDLAEEAGGKLLSMARASHSVAGLGTVVPKASATWAASIC